MARRNHRDTQGAAISGIHSEFLCSSRLDNLASCFVGLEALVEHAQTKLHEEREVCLLALFDHEEVGARSRAYIASRRG